MIHILHDYRGARTGFRMIPAGTYAVGDPRLMGLESYLAERGHARLDTPQVDDQKKAVYLDASDYAAVDETLPPPEPPAVDHRDYESMTVAELREAAQQRGIPVLDEDGEEIAPSKTTKPQLIAALLADDAARTGEDEAERHQ